MMIRLNLFCLFAGLAAALLAENHPYLVVDLATGASHYADQGPDLADDACRTTQLWLRHIPAGAFVMGSPEGEPGKCANEPEHEVTISRDFYLGVFEVTQAQFELIAAQNPAKYPGPANPVEWVSYEEIRGTSPEAGAGWPARGHAVDDGSFLAKLRAKTKLEFDLPTEAQWEYACRAGTTAPFNNGKALANTAQDPALDDLGRYAFNTSDGRGGHARHTHVGSYQPNAWGLYDMHGNVWEWCLDWMDDLEPAPADDPVGPMHGDIRVFRGGGWFGEFGQAQYCRAACRPFTYRGPYFHCADCGFRLALNP